MTTLKVADADIRSRHLDYGRLIDRVFAQGCIVPTRHHHTIEMEGQPDATLLLMPAWSSNSDDVKYLGVKLVTVFPSNSARAWRASLQRFNVCAPRWRYGTAFGHDGRQPHSARRTVATSALAARYLSREDSRKLLVLASGRVASLIPEAYRAVRPIAEVSVWDINQESAARMVADLSNKGFLASIESDLESGVRNADIVTAATLATSR
ncbi:hypothetical protein [Mesorhizobium sp. M0208]|uniref:hypothetical protein n=1 Tax=Mesorhizobium sp. M0208 TaxID=2956916 RepID=UPI00333DEB2E